MFQQTIGANIAFGVVGELFLEGPLRAQPAILSSATPANNVIGRAFFILDDATGSYDTIADPQPLEVGAGNVSGTQVFAGILANPKVYANYGTVGDSLAANLVVPNTTMVELVQESAGIIIQVPAVCAIGDWVYATNATGILTTTAPGASAPALSTRIPGGVITRYESAAAGLAVMALGNVN
jgi:hypothetical protein